MRVREQQAEHAARRPDSRIDLVGECHHDELRQRRREHAHEVVRGEPARTDDLLECAAEHVQREHVEEQVDEAAVQESVGQELPGLEAHLAAGRGRRGERPQAKGSAMSGWTVWSR